MNRPKRKVSHTNSNKAEAAHSLQCAAIARRNGNIEAAHYFVDRAAFERTDSLRRPIVAYSIGPYYFTRRLYV